MRMRRGAEERAQPSKDLPPVLYPTNRQGLAHRNPYKLVNCRVLLLNFLPGFVSFSIMVDSLTIELKDVKSSFEYWIPWIVTTGGKL